MLKVHDRMEMSITLCLGATIISGITISYQSFIERIKDTLSRNTRFSDLRDKVESVFTVLAQAHEEISDEVAAEDLHAYITRYIHLRDARITTIAGSDVSVPQEGGLWRGKVSSVDGFFLGQIYTA